MRAGLALLTLGACSSLSPCPSIAADGGASDGRIAVASTPLAQIAKTHVNVAGRGHGHVGAFRLEGDVGTVEIEGITATALHYASSSFAGRGEQLHQTLVVAPDRLWLVWFYCQDGNVEDLYLEGTDGVAAGFDGGEGTCATTGSAAPAASFPAIDMPYPRLVDGLRFDGPLLSYDGAHPGRATIEGRDVVLLPFAKVDCADCGDPGWQELHTLTWDPSASELCVSLFYFFKSGQVILPGNLCLPSLSEIPEGLFFDASWQHCGR